MNHAATVHVAQTRPTRGVECCGRLIPARWILPLAIVLAALSAHPAVPAAPTSAPPVQPMTLRVGFLKRAFTGVNRNDAEAAYKVFAAAVARRRGYAIHCTTHVFEDAAAFEPEILAGKIDLAIIDTWNFLAMDVGSAVTPVFFPSNRDTPGKRYVVVTRRDSHRDRLEDLRGLEISEFEMSTADLGRAWLETLLRSTHLATHTTFFRQVVTVHKPSAAVLPVFFGQSPAGLVDESGLQIMTELNPQVGAQLQVIARSELLADAVLCLKNSGWPTETRRRDMIDALAKLPDYPGGQQILSLFRIGRLIPFDEAHLDTVRKLRTTHDRLQPKDPS